MQKSRVKTMLTVFFYAKDIIHHEIVPEKQTVDGRFYKEVTKKLIAEFIALGLSFRKVGPGIFCTTMHRRILRALPPSFWRGEGSPCYPIHPTPLI
jgi:hypothetical protein